MSDMIGEEFLAVLPGQLAEKVTGDDPQERDKYQYCIQNTDTGKILKGTKMGYSFFLRGIIDVYRNVFNGNASPCCKDEGFQFKFIFSGLVPSVYIHPLQRVEPVAGLCIFQFDPCLQGKPEIGELVGKCILSRHIVRS